MATLNLSKIKHMSEANLRRLVSTLVGLMSSVSALEDQCIKEYDETKTYQKGQIVVGSDGYFYEAVTVTNGVFDSSKWTKIGTDNFEELDVDTIKGFLGLTPEQLETMADLISTEIRLDKVFSSSDTYTRIDNALKEAKEYCLTQLAKKSTGSFKKATSTAEVTDGNYLYLILNSVTSKYDIYALVDSNVELLTSVDVNLDNYFTKAEIEADFLKKVDADGKYATITTVDGKVDKDKIVTVLNDTVTDEQVASAKAVYDNVESINKTIEEIKTNFEGGVNTIYNAVVAKGVTPTDKTPSSIAEAIAQIADITEREMIALIPIMTSNTTPSGVASASSVYSSSYPAWCAFSRNSGRFWHSNNGMPVWIAYEFENPVVVRAIEWKGGADNYRVTKFKVQGSNDNTTWEDVTTELVNSYSQTNVGKHEFKNDKSYKAYRLYITSASSGYIEISMLQMYGYE